MKQTDVRRLALAAAFLLAALTSVEVRPAAAAPPIAAQDNYEVVPNTSLNVAAPGVLSNDGDADGDPLQAVLVGSAANGTVVLNPDGSFDYAPNPGFNGVDQFAYQASDGTEQSGTAPVFILVNTVPVGVDDTYATATDTPLVVAAPGVTGNDLDPDGGSLGAYLTYSTSFGTLALNESDGSFTYTPNPGFEGTDGFGYQPFDGLVSGTPASVIIVVGDGSSPPVAADDEFFLSTGSIGVGAPGILINDLDPDGDPMTAVLVAGPAQGKATLNADGSLYYETDPGFTGTDSFTYQAFDGKDLSNVATVTFYVDSAPFTGDDAYTTPLDTPLVVPAPGVLANDGDPDGDPVTAFPPFDGPFHGTLILNDDGSFTYTPDASFQGVDAFYYNAYDGTSLGNPGAVIITAGAGSAPPTAVDDAYDVEQDGKIVVPPHDGILANDSDPNGDSFTAGYLDLPTNGTLSPSDDGSFTYEPDPGFVGTDTFTYQAWDDEGPSNVATVTITVVGAVGPNDPIDPPHAEDDAYQTAQDTPLTVLPLGLFANDHDPDGDTLTLHDFDDTSLVGTLSIGSDGGFVFTPAPGFVGTTSFLYRVTDGSAVSNVAGVSIEVTAAPDPSPDPSPDSSPKPSSGSDSTLSPGSNPSANGGDTSTTFVTTLPGTGTGTGSREPAHSATPWAALVLGWSAACLGAINVRRSLACQPRTSRL
jgi:hypothetical protein